MDKTKSIHCDPNMGFSYQFFSKPCVSTKKEEIIFISAINFFNAFMYMTLYTTNSKAFTRKEIESLVVT